jgi:hypothetical protein
MSTIVPYTSTLSKRTETNVIQRHRAWTVSQKRRDVGNRLEAATESRQIAPHGLELLRRAREDLLIRMGAHAEVIEMG